MKKIGNTRVRVLVLLVVFIIITLSYINISTITYDLPVSSASNPQANLSYFIMNDIPHYNFRIGYVNFSGQNHLVSFAYLLRPFNGLNPVKVGSAYYSGGDVSSTLVTIIVYQIAANNSKISVPFMMHDFSLKSPQGFDGKIESWDGMEYGSLIIVLNPHGTFNQPDPFLNALGNYPGNHDFYLNFTLTIYNTFGPYKFPGQSKTVHLEYNNTIVE